MDPAKRIVTRLPLTELWNSAGIVDARRVGDIGEADIVRLLQDGSSLVVADVGQPLLWIADEDRFAYWKAEISCHLVGAGAAGFSRTTPTTIAMSRPCGSAHPQPISLLLRSTIDTATGSSV